MHIFLRQDLTARLVHEMHGGFDELTAAWEEKADEQSAFPKPRQRSTIYRWLVEGIPFKRSFSKKDQNHDFQIFALCSLLDVDPLAILDYRKNGYFSHFSKFRTLFYYGFQELDGFAHLIEMYRPDDVWPSENIARIFYGRLWFSHQFANADSWKFSDYLLVKVNFYSPIYNRPRAVHIAYRRLGVSDTMWRYYGTVLLREGIIELYSESGDFQSMGQAIEDEIKFRTYYGGGSVEWKIASLHDFHIAQKFPCDDSKIIGFNW